VPLEIGDRAADDDVAVVMRGQAISAILLQRLAKLRGDGIGEARFDGLIDEGIDLHGLIFGDDAIDWPDGVGAARGEE